MIIFPAIDLKDGKCVRLYKGDFNKTTIFNSSPFNQALEFQKKGFTHLHLVDLDGALKGKSKNKKIIIKIIKKTSLNVQLGGGIRTLKQISFWIKNGVSTVVVGTMAIQNPKILKKACTLFPGQIAVALDIRNNFLAMKGWVKQTKIKLMQFSKKLENFECGVEAKGNARLPFSVKYFLTAILFVLFDVEVIFFYPWATNFKEFGMDGLLSMALFVALFLLGFLYLRKKQAFKWE